MTEVIKVLTLNIILSYIVLQFKFTSDFEQIFGAILIGVPYVIILWGFAPQWFEYKGSNSLVRSLWVISFIPMWPLVFIFWIF